MVATVTVRQVRLFGDPVLTMAADPVTDFDKSLRTLVRDLSETLRDIDSAAVTAAMDYRYPPGAVRRLDDDLLSRFGETYLALHGNAHRRDSLEARRARLTG